METALHAERDGVIERVVAPAGTQVDANTNFLCSEPIHLNRAVPGLTRQL